RTAPVPPAPRPGTAPSTGPTSLPVVVHVLQERIVAVEHDHAVAALERRAVRLQAALESIEAGVAAGGLAVDARGLRVTLTAQLLRGALGLGQDHGACAVGLGADRLRLLLARGAQAAGHLLALGAHAPVHVADHAAVGGQVDLLDAQVDDADADVAGAGVDVLQLALDHFRAVAGHHFRQRARVDLVAQRILG